MAQFLPNIKNIKNIFSLIEENKKQLWVKRNSHLLDQIPIKEGKSGCENDETPLYDLKEDR
jgi:hypothetical protein